MYPGENQHWSWSLCSRDHLEALPRCAGQSCSERIPWAHQWRAHHPTTSPGLCPTRKRALCLESRTNWRSSSGVVVGYEGCVCPCPDEKTWHVRGLPFLHTQGCFSKGESLRLEEVWVDVLSRQKPKQTPAWSTWEELALVHGG